jgi:hypothetical protein
MFEYLASAVDPDSTIPTIAIINVPSWMTVVDSYVSGTPHEGYADTSFVVTASDGFLADTLEVQVDVIPVNDPPYVTSQAVDTATVDVPYAYVGTAEDPDGTVPAIAFADYPSWLIAVDNNLLGVPPLGAADTTFVVIASDEEFADSLLVTLYVLGGCDYIPGDVNGNGDANGVDITYSVNFFKGFGEAPSSLCPCPPHADLYVSGDVNSNCLFNGVDITYFVNFLKGVGPELGFCADCPPGGPAKAGNGRIRDHFTPQIQNGR